MRYEPAMNEPTAPRWGRADVAFPWPARPARVGDGGEARSRQAAELDIWEDDGGTPLGRAARYPRR
jgi:hypothetical protein